MDIGIAPLIIAGYFIFNILGVSGIILFIIAGIKILKTYKGSRVLPRKSLVMLIVAIIFLLSQLVLIEHEQYQYADQDRILARKSGIQFYEPQSTIDGAKTDTISMPAGYRVNYKPGGSISQLIETTMESYDMLGDSEGSDCYISSKALENRNRSRQQIIVTGTSDGKRHEKVVKSAPPIKNDCLSLGKTGGGIEVFVEKHRYNSGYLSYSALAKVGDTFVQLKLEKRVDGQKILNYFDNLQPTNPEDIKFINKDNKLLFVNLL